MDSQNKELLSRASEFMKQKDYASTISLLKKSETKSDILLGLLAAAYAEIGMIEEAEASLLRLLAFHPDNHLARFQLGVLLYQRDEVDDALKIMHDLADHSLDTAATFFLAQSYYEQGNFDNAVSYIKQLRNRIEPAHPLSAKVDALETGILEVARVNGITFKN